MCASAHLLERTKVGGDGEDVERALDGDEMPLVAGGQKRSARHRPRPLAVRSDDTRVQIEQGVGKPGDIAGRCGYRHVEILGKSLPSVSLNSDAADGHVFDIVARK